MSPTVQAKVCAHDGAFSQRAAAPVYANGEREQEVNAVIAGAREARRLEMSAVGARKSSAA